MDINVMMASQSIFWESTEKQCYTCYHKQCLFISPVFKKNNTKKQKTFFWVLANILSKKAILLGSAIILFIILDFLV